ncbi:hypothetical protein [Jeotgalibacillus malaysiensis]|uniref:hypothetical protein n=1 Tax=Jeotgalibacillus malaysiensis TaxID=1508404 RepID=UPI00384BD90E
MNFDCNGQKIYEPSPNDSEQIHFMYEWLKEHCASLAGASAYEQVLEQYQTTRIEWETERLRLV